jgi:hypothetical protein
MHKVAVYTSITGLMIVIYLPYGVDVDVDLDLDVDG